MKQRNPLWSQMLRMCKSVFGRAWTNLVRAVNLIGTREFVKERLAAFREAGVTTLNVAPIASTTAERIKLIETLRQLV